VENAVNNCIKPPRAYAVIANPHEETLRMVEISAARLSARQK
jgi:ethanolamine utilization protein EutM